MNTIGLVYFEEIINLKRNLSIYRWWYDCGATRYFEEFPIRWYKNHIAADYNPIWSYAPADLAFAQTRNRGR